MKHWLLCLDVKEASSICSDMKLITQYNQQNILLKKLNELQEEMVSEFSDETVGKSNYQESVYLLMSTSMIQYNISQCLQSYTRYKLSKCR